MYSHVKELKKTGLKIFGSIIIILTWETERRLGNLNETAKRHYMSQRGNRGHFIKMEPTLWVLTGLITSNACHGVAAESFLVR